MDESTGGPLQQRVRRERRLRGLSIRQAAIAGAVSNTLWGTWERSHDEPSPAVRRGIALAFDWPTDWPENPPPVRQPSTDHHPDPGIDAVLAAVNLVLDRLDSLEQRFDALERQAD